MLENYLKIARRNLLKRKFYSLVTIFGLSVGMTFTFLIGSYIWGEILVNRTLHNSENQYIIRSKWKNPDMGVYGFPLLQGDARTALSRLNSIVITENKAIKYFGKSDVLGQTLTLHKHFFFLDAEKLLYNRLSHAAS